MIWRHTTWTNNCYPALTTRYHGGFPKRSEGPGRYANPSKEHYGYLISPAGHEDVANHEAKGSTVSNLSAVSPPSHQPSDYDDVNLPVFTCSSKDFLLLSSKI